MNREETPARGSPTAASDGLPHVGRRSRLRWLIYLCLAAALLAAFHAPLLRGVWNFLVVAAPVHDKSDVLAVRVTDIQTVRAVIDLYERGLVDRVLLPPADLRTTDVLGLTEPTPVETRRELTARGVPEARIEDLPTDGFSLRRAVHGAAAYLREHPDKRLTVVMPRLQGRYVRQVVGEVLDADLWERVAYFSVPPQQYDEAHWWTARLAVQQVFKAYVEWGTEATTDLPYQLEGKIDWQAFDAAVARGEKP